MAGDDYLQAVLDDQDLPSDGEELKSLREREDKVTKVLRDSYGGEPTLEQGGSVAKGTLIKESYDLDLPFYFSRDDDSAGETLQQIYEDVAENLSAGFHVERKRSALRLHDLEDSDIDFHIDVVPGRFVSEDEDYAFLYQNAGDAERLQTNLEIQIEHIAESGVVPAIRLMKLWNVRHQVGVKTFILELLVVKLLDGRESDSVSDQLLHVLTEFRDRESLSVEDPANSNNDLTWSLDSVHPAIRATAERTLEMIEDEGWEEVFGEVEEMSAKEKAAAVTAATAAVSRPNRPWAV